MSHPRTDFLGAVGLLAMAIGGGAAGCATAAPLNDADPDLAHYFVLRTYGDSQQARLEGDRLHGSEIDMVRLRDGFRGQAYSRLIDLRLEADVIVGMVGPDRTELFVDEIPEGLRLKGVYAGALGDIELRTDSIRGSVGRCQYDLRRVSRRGFWYEGRAMCPGGLVPAQLGLPDELPGRPLLERAVSVAVFLGRS